MKIIECPRDAMQGFDRFIPTEDKVAYLNMLLKVGFDTLDFGSFVSPKAIPQMRDTVQVLSKLNDSETKLLSIVANKRGAEDACSFPQIDYLGYPFSVSETFQKLNTNKSIDESLILVEDLQNLCVKSNKSLVVYLSMAFGNPFQELWHQDIVAKWSQKLVDLGIETIALADTLGVSNKESIDKLFGLLVPEFEHVEWGAHLHTTSDTWKEKVQSAYDNGCNRFDSAVMGYGGCPMSENKLVGNLATEKLLTFVAENEIENKLNTLAFESAYNKAISVFSK